MNMGTVFQPLILLQPGEYLSDISVLISPAEEGLLTTSGGGVPMPVFAGEVLRCTASRSFTIDVEFRASNRLTAVEPEQQ